MSQKRQIPDDHEIQETLAQREDHRGSNYPRWAFWALATLVVLCLVLVTWFWAVLLYPPSSNMHPLQGHRTPDNRPMNLSAASDGRSL